MASGPGFGAFSGSLRPVFLERGGPRRRGGEIDRLSAEVERAEQRYVASERLLREQVRRFHRELVNGRERLAIAQRGVQASQEQVRIGLIEYRNGRSTAFELVHLKEDLVYRKPMVTGSWTDE